MFKNGNSSPRQVLGKEEEDELIIYGKVNKFAKKTDPIPELKDVPYLNKIPFYALQLKIATRNCGYINPGNLEEYVARGGYEALHKAVGLSPEAVIKEVKGSGLRGRGGGGFSTGQKWEFARKSQSDVKYVICNADEGDPGAYMDRSLLEGDPHSILEGMAIGGYAMGAQTGIIYCRAEYPLAVATLERAIKQAEEAGFLGDHVFGSDFNFKIKIVKGQGAFVCGEETALIASIEGKMGEPRPRPPFPAVSGLWGKPTNINNVETWANIAPIITRGAEWFSSYGTEGSKGTKVFALVGNILNNGLVEVPMGTKIADIVYETGGGCGDYALKAIQLGGPSGGCITRDMIDLQVDYEVLKEVGAIMGSGGMVVMDERTCMVDVARYFLDFTQGESCGKCTPCREGTRQMLLLLNKICTGNATMDDLKILEELSLAVRDAALCGLGQTAPNPVLSTLKYFREEYEEHIIDNYCRASVCEDMMVAPCQNTCPAGIDVPLYIDAIKQGNYRESYELIYRDNPLPATCGRVCPALCARRCRRGLLDDAIGIRELKRFAADQVMAHDSVKITAPAKKNGKSVGIIGSGPAGLTSAYYLARLGYDVTVYEALSVAGGMMAVGIPEFRLPAVVLNKEISLIEDLGVKIKTGVRVGKDLSIKKLRKKHDALFIGVGAHKDQTLGIPGEDLKGVISGVEFLRDISLGKKVDLTGKTVVIIGGGNVAIDVARTSLRLGAKAHIVYRREEKDMPAFASEIQEAREEGTKFSFLAAPLKAVGNKQKELTQIVLQKMELGAYDKSGRRRPTPIKGAEITLDADLIVPAIGQEPAYENVDEELKLNKNRGNTLVVDKRSMATNVEGVFAGGDCVSGPATVVEAIGAGKRAAAAIDQYLGGSGVLYEYEKPVRKLVGPVAEAGLLVKPDCMALDKRLASFDEVEFAYTREQAFTEAKRCMRCDIKESDEEGPNGHCPGCGC
jgi:NADH-quinone oxidoreductase subunit F